MAGPQTQGLRTGRFDDRPAKVLIVVAPYYRDIADQLLQGGARRDRGLGRHPRDRGGPRRPRDPHRHRHRRRLGEFHAFVALGCVIRGETTHYDTVVEESAHGLTVLGLQGQCIGNGILTVENVEQARVRAEAAGQDKGGGAAAAALHLLQLSRRFARAEKGVGFLQGRLGGAA
jgi:6,7-dimethyl-8-ribityllumazine synthase